MKIFLIVCNITELAYIGDVMDKQLMNNNDYFNIKVIARDHLHNDLWKSNFYTILIKIWSKLGADIRPNQIRFSFFKNTASKATTKKKLFSYLHV